MLWAVSGEWLGAGTLLGVDSFWLIVEEVIQAVGGLRVVLNIIVLPSTYFGEIRGLNLYNS